MGTQKNHLNEHPKQMLKIMSKKDSQFYAENFSLSKLMICVKLFLLNRLLYNVHTILSLCGWYFYDFLSAGPGYKKIFHAQLSEHKIYPAHTCSV